MTLTLPAGHDHHAAHAAAVAAVHEILPQISEKEAVQQAIEAVAYAATYHTKWFWRGVHG